MDPRMDQTLVDGQGFCFDFRYNDLFVKKGEGETDLEIQGGGEEGRVRDARGEFLRHFDDDSAVRFLLSSKK